MAGRNPTFVHQPPNQVQVGALPITRSEYNISVLSCCVLVLSVLSDCSTRPEIILSGCEAFGCWPAGYVEGTQRYEMEKNIGPDSRIKVFGDIYILHYHP